MVNNDHMLNKNARNGCSRSHGFSQTLKPGSLSEGGSEMHYLRPLGLSGRSKGRYVPRCDQRPIEGLGVGRSKGLEEASADARVSGKDSSRDPR